MEAKNWDFKMGSAHGVLGMEVDVDNSSEGCIYGIVTNYVEWEFLKRTDAASAAVILRYVSPFDMKLFCTIIGADGAAFPVDMRETDDTVGDLKDTIRAKKINDLVNIDADKMRVMSGFELD
ncbi:hypothetical protein PR003_g22689 [Phytophthora rubi]|uniref:Crinkler effector protein N-terminal domain-containing protein n=1 Tax=Phytophthora rubi TaxID=129364 RepID=A0A6A4D1V2_9STRA|nr:hypothetical protein PR003_g22689 [Phytophthora rubi]